MKEGKTEEMSQGIAYQNKDIASKILAEKFTGKSLNVYGFNLPKIKEVLPTNLPAIQADELRLDNLFLLEDGSLAIIDYESTYKEENKVKYLNYVARIANQYYSNYKTNLNIRILVLYTADVKKEQTTDCLNLNSVTLKIEQAFLSEMDFEQIKEKLDRKIRRREPLTDEEMMQFIILPLTCKGKEKKNEMIETLFDISKDVKDETTQIFLLSGVLVFTDKVIDEELAKKMKEWIGMTKVAKLFEEEKQQEIRITVERVTAQLTEKAEKEKEKLIEKAKKEKEDAVKKEKEKAKKEKEKAKKEQEQTAKNLLKNGVSIEIILNATPLTRKEIEKIQSELEEEKTKEIAKTTPPKENPSPK